MFRLVIKYVAGDIISVGNYLVDRGERPDWRPGWLYDRCRSAPGFILTIFSFVLHYVIFRLPVIRTDREVLKYTDNIQHSLPSTPFSPGDFFTLIFSSVIFYNENIVMGIISLCA